MRSWWASVSGGASTGACVMVAIHYDYPLNILFSAMAGASTMASLIAAGCAVFIVAHGD
jgi:hypothetical protein